MWFQNYFSMLCGSFFILLILIILYSLFVCISGSRRTTKLTKEFIIYYISFKVKYALFRIAVSYFWIPAWFGLNIPKVQLTLFWLFFSFIFVIKICIWLSDMSNGHHSNNLITLFTSNFTLKNGNFFWQKMYNKIYKYNWNS